MSVIERFKSQDQQSDVIIRPMSMALSKVWSFCRMNVDPVLADFLKEDG